MDEFVISPNKNGLATGAITLTEHGSSEFVDKQSIRSYFHLPYVKYSCEILTPQAILYSSQIKISILGKFLL